MRLAKKTAYDRGYVGINEDSSSPDASRGQISHFVTPVNFWRGMGDFYECSLKDYTSNGGPLGGFGDWSLSGCYK